MDLHCAARELGVHYQTAYRWVRDGSLAARKVGSAYEIDDDELRAFAAARRAPEPPPRAMRVRDWAKHVDRLLERLLSGDELRARAITERLHAGGVTTVDLCERLLTPAMREVGERWARGDCSVAEEHRASAICERLVARVAVHPRGRPHGTAVVTTPPGELHALPAGMAAAVLRSERWLVHHLGASVPASDLCALAADVGADFAVLSVTHADSSTSARVTADAVEAVGVRALVGSPGASLRGLLSDAAAIRLRRTARSGARPEDGLGRGQTGDGDAER